ncbi:MAG: hypothetical protein KGJ07_06270, partial [Patescibacteria group bacterium]|nr:hypothetical protein [Patescibacteria group bacterium]
MNKLLLSIIGVLFVACLVEGYWINKERSEKIALAVLTVTNAQKQEAARPKPTFLTKGQKFADSPLYSKAFLIAPVTGNVSAAAQKALNGWTVTSKENTDGTTTVSLTPKDADDVSQTYTLKTGYKLYFIELNPSD